MREASITSSFSSLSFVTPTPSINEGKDRVRVNLDHLACRKHLLEMIAEKEGRERLKKPGGIYKKGCWCGERLRAKAGGDEILTHTLKGKLLFPHDLVLSAGAQTEEGTSPTLSHNSQRSVGGLAERLA